MLPGDEEELVPDGCDYPQLWAVVRVDRVQMTAWDRGGGDADEKTLAQMCCSLALSQQWSQYKGHNALFETDFHTIPGLV